MSCTHIRLQHLWLLSNKAKTWKVLYICLFVVPSLFFIFHFLSFRVKLLQKQRHMSRADRKPGSRCSLKLALPTNQSGPGFLALRSERGLSLTLLFLYQVAHIGLQCQKKYKPENKHDVASFSVKKKRSFLSFCLLTEWQNLVQMPWSPASYLQGNKKLCFYTKGVSHKK